jgi:DNA-binding response OmpR family regulator
MAAASGSNQNPESGRRSVSQSRAEASETETACHVLIVEDNESDVFLIERALERAKIACLVRVAKNGQEAVQFFNEADADSRCPCPHVVILDINLPKRLGSDVLKHMRQSRRCANAHVIVVTTSDSSRDREVMERLGVDGYFTKPSDFDEFMKLGDLVKSVIRPIPN